MTAIASQFSQWRTGAFNSGYRAPAGQGSHSIERILGYDNYGYEFYAYSNYGRLTDWRIWQYNRTKFWQEYSGLRTDNNLANRWTPIEIGSVVKIWLQGDHVGGANGAAVDTWVEDSGNSNNAVTAGNSPDLAAASLNGLNTVDFVAANLDLLVLPSGCVSSFTEGSMFFVVKRNSDPGSGSGSPAALFGTDVLLEVYPLADGNIYNGFLSTARKTVGDPGDLASWHIGLFQSKASDWRYAFNGVDFYTTATNTVGASTGSPLVGGPAGGFYFDGKIAEIIVCNSFLTTDERQRVEGYLAWKWGLVANLDVAHPYKSTPPLIEPPVGGKIKVWSGAWTEKPIKVWDGGGWIEKPLKVWNGGSWILA